MGQKLVLASKILGAAALGVVGYDAHRKGKAVSKVLPIENNSNALASLYSAQAKNPSLSAVGQMAQDMYIEQRAGTKFFKTKDTAWGYVKGFCSHLTDSILPFGLAVTALAGRGMVSQAGGIGLALYGLYYAATNIFHIGQKKDIQY